VLTQLDDDAREFVVTYVSRFNKKNAKYSSYEGECLVVVWILFFNVIFMVAHLLWLLIISP
jgi:hypothetical protein